MSVVSSDIIILSVYKEIVSVTRFYVMATSPPTVEQSVNPSELTDLGWSIFEPEYNSAGTLYYIDVTTFSDGTWQYSPVGTSSSYEAAKEAARQATNYIQPTDTGFIVGNMTDAVLGKNVLIDTDSLDIRNGDTVLASFGANLIELGKESDSAEIILCNGTAKLTNKNDIEGMDYKRLGIYSKNEVGVDSENFSVSASYAGDNVEHNIDISAFTHIPWSLDPDDPLLGGGSLFKVLADTWLMGEENGNQHNQAFLELDGFGAMAGLAASCGDTAASITLNGMKGLITIAGDVEMIDELMLAGTKVSPMVTDSGWINLTATKGTWEYLRYRRLGKSVVVEGHATSISWSGSTGDTIVANGKIPSSLRPATSAKYFFALIGGKRIARLGINTNGGIFLDYCSTLAGSNYTDSTWMNFTFAYYID